MSEQKDYISFTYASFEQFKEVYRRAVDYKDNSFVFDDREFLTDYAKYVIQYLQPKFDRLKEACDDLARENECGSGEKITHADTMQ